MVSRTTACFAHRYEASLFSPRNATRAALRSLVIPAPRAPARPARPQPHARHPLAHAPAQVGRGGPDNFSLTV